MKTFRFAAAGILSLMFPLHNSLDLNAATIVRNLGDTVVQGAWAVLPDDTYSIQPDFYNLDINGDARTDLRFEHGFRRPPLYLEREAGSQLLVARQGLNEIERMLQKIRSLAIDSAVLGINDDDSFQANEAEVQNALEVMDRIANNTMQGRLLLNGQSGKTGFVSDPNMMSVARVGDDVLEGSYVVNIDTMARRGSVSAAFPQSASLVEDEILSINGVNVQLYAGMEIDDVIDRINEFNGLTGVTAIDNGGVTTLYSHMWGTEGEVTVISNQGPSSQTSGFENTSETGVGVDLVIDVDGSSYRGQGNVAQVTSGAAKGLVVRVQTDTSDETVSTQGFATVTISDQSLQYLLRPTVQGQYLTVAFPDARSSSLGIGVTNNQFAVLDQILVANASKAQDSLAVIDTAIDEIGTERHQLDQIYDLYYNAQGQSFVTAANMAGETEIAMELQPLSEGSLVDENTPFREGPMELVGTSDMDGTGRFLGFRFFDGVDSHYGWIRIDLASDNSLILKELVYESEPGRGVRVGHVPEPATHLTALAAFTGLCVARRRFCTRG